jgi:hypothetical protein
MSDEKKLSDLGEKMWRNMHKIEFYDSIWYGEAFEHERLKTTKEVWVYTEEERRELVRLCLRKVFAEIEEAGIRFSRLDWQLIDEDIEAFVKREGF